MGKVLVGKGGGVESVTLVDLAEDDDAGELCVRVARYRWVEEEYAWACSADCGGVEEDGGGWHTHAP